jgi:DNA-binding NarL/FixJ family response regulator
MANNKLALINTWCNLITQENNYYKATAEHLLCKEKILQPTPFQLQSTINRLLYFNLSFSIKYGDRLSQKEIESLYYASCGEELKDSALTLERSIDSLKRHRMNALKKLQCKNIPQAIYRATQLGYLPLKEEILNHSTEVKEVENTTV